MKTSAKRPLRLDMASDRQMGLVGRAKLLAMAPTARRQDHGDSEVLQFQHMLPFPLHGF